MTTIGPFESEQDARNHPAVRAVYAGDDPASGNYGMLMAAVTAAGVEPGAYDSLILAWLAHYEPATCAVMAGLITRASGQ